MSGGNRKAHAGEVPAAREVSALRDLIPHAASLQPALRELHSRERAACGGASSRTSDVNRPRGLFDRGRVPVARPFVCLALLLSPVFMRQKCRPIGRQPALKLCDNQASKCDVFSDVEEGG
jgi:hypothetical protein